MGKCRKKKEKIENYEKKVYYVFEAFSAENSKKIEVLSDPFTDSYSLMLEVENSLRKGCYDLYRITFLGKKEKWEKIR